MNRPFETDPFGCFVGAPVVVPGREGWLRVAIKDNFHMQGLPTGAGLAGPGPVALCDAPIVARLREAGCTLLGKTAMDELAFGATGANPHSGRTENPRAPGHSPGGSSGGSAAAVAAGLCDAALGTDTLGSIRIPAAYCGVVGLKPTRGLLSMAGIIPLSWSLDHPGLLAATAAPIAELLELLAGPPAAAQAEPLTLLVPEQLTELALDGAIARVFADTLQTLAASGWSVEHRPLPAWSPEPLRRAGLLLTEAEAAVAHAGLLTREDALSPDLRRMLLFGRDCGAGRVVRALRTLREAADALEDALGGGALLALPTVPAPAFAWGDGPPVEQADLTVPANFGGNPAISLPMGQAPDLRPIGLQLIAQRGADWPLLHAARRIETTLKLHRPGSAQRSLPGAH